MLAKVMNWVSRHILLALFMCLFLLLSCGSSHKAIKSDTEVISKDSASETVNIVHESTTSLSELITTNGSYVINFGFMIQESRPTVLPGNLHVEGNFNKKEDKQTVVADTTNVKADKEATSIKHEKTKTEEVKKKKESTLLKQIGFACICVTVLLVVMLLRQYFWRNNMTIFIIRL